MRKIGLFFIISLTCSCLYAGRLDKAFKALDNFDYFGAKELFEKSLDKDIVAAPYGLSIIFSTSDNPFYNIDSAYKYISLADSNFHKIDEKQRSSILEYKIDAQYIGELKDSIDKKAFQKIEKSEQVQDFQHYLDYHTDSEYRDRATARRNELAFEEAKVKNTALDYQMYYLQYPEAKEVIEAKNRYEERLFVESTIKGQAADYNYFVKKYPESPYVNAAQDSVYAIYTRTKTVKNYHNFITNNPNNYHINEAWRNMYKLYTAEYSPQRIIEFRIEYPDYPFIEELKLDMKLAAKEFLPFKKDSKWGFMDRSGEVMIPAKYDLVEDYAEGLSLVFKDQKIGFIDKSGSLIIPMEYDDGESFTGGLAIVSKDGSYGMVDRTNKQRIPLKYELIGAFNSNLALVANETAYGYVNKTASEVIPLDLNYATDFQSGFAVVEVDGKKGIINSIGKLVVPASYTWLEVFNRFGICRAKNDSLFGLLNKSGGEQLAFEYDNIGEFSQGLAMVAKNGKYGYVDRVGHLKIPLKYTFRPEALVWGKIENGYSKFLKEDKYGVLDSAGNEVLPALFEDIGVYNPKQLVAVKRRGKWGYTDETVKLKIPYDFHYAYSFNSDRGVVKKDSLWGVIGVDGKWLLEPSYDEIVPFDTLGYLVKSKSLYGLISNEFDTLLNLSYGKVELSNFSGLIKLHTKDDSILYYDYIMGKMIEPKN